MLTNCFDGYENLTTSLSRDAVYDLTSDMLCTENFDVAAFYDISTSYINKTPTASTEIITQQTNQDYESDIRETPSLVCKFCDRFLFSNQARVLGSITNSLIKSLKIDCSSKLCRTCYSQLSQGSIPTLCSLLNGLQIDSISDEINCLSSLEKKLLAKIQICMTVVLLPGGQYAERGLIVALPRNVETCRKSKWD